jgi:site-specific DNA recombinase
MTMTTQVKAAAIYTRLSQDRTGESLGIDRQEHLCRDLADRKGWPIAEVYTDRDFSAYTGKKRPAYSRLVDDLKNGIRDAVIVVDQDRLTRSPKELEAFIDLADGHGIALASASGEVDLSTSDGRFRARIMGTVGRQESEKKSERLKRQREQAARLGQFQGGPRRYGFEPDGLTIRPAEAKVIREIARRLLAGQSARSIVIDLNGRGVSSAKGGPWSIAQLRKMMSAPRLAGLRTHNGEVVGDAEWQAILSRADHERLRALVDGRRTGRGRPAVSLLGGIATCGRCGAVLHQTRQTGKPVYRCSAIRAGVCSGVGVQSAPLDDLITEAVLYRLDSKPVKRALARPARKVSTAVDTSADDLSAIDTALDELAADLGSGLISRREWLAAREPLDRRRKAALAMFEPEGPEDRAVDAIRGAVDVRAYWQKRSTEERRQILAALIERVALGPTTRPGSNSFDPDRVDIAWKV